MKTKIIAVVVSIVIIAGVGTAVGVTVSKSNDKETESLVNEAVSHALASALATEESTAEESTTEESTTEESSKPSSSQSSSSPKNNAPSQTKASTSTTKKATTTTEPQVVYKVFTEPVHYNYKDNFYKVARYKGDLCNVNKRTSDGPDDGKYFLLHGADYWSLEEIKGQYEFVSDRKIKDTKLYDSNNEPYWEIANSKDLYLDEYGKVFYFSGNNRVYTGE